jgi:hypothetical protein
MGITKFQARLILPTFCISFLIAHSGFLSPDLFNSGAQTAADVASHLYHALKDLLQL